MECKMSRSIRLVKDDSPDFSQQKLGHNPSLIRKYKVITHPMSSNNHESIWNWENSPKTSKFAASGRRFIWAVWDRHPKRKKQKKQKNPFSPKGIARPQSRACTILCSQKAIIRIWDCKKHRLLSWCWRSGGSWGVGFHGGSCGTMARGWWTRQQKSHFTTRLAWYKCSKSPSIQFKLWVKTLSMILKTIARHGFSRFLFNQVPHVLACNRPIPMFFLCVSGCIDGAYYFMFRVCDLRSQHALVEPHIRCYCVEQSDIRGGAVRRRVW